MQSTHNVYCDQNHTGRQQCNDALAPIEMQSITPIRVEPDHTSMGGSRTTVVNFCTNCGTKRPSDAAKFCTACGSGFSVSAREASTCRTCGAQLSLPIARHCTNCGNPTGTVAAVPPMLVPSASYSRGGGKSKTTTVPLAIFTRPWNRFYTYREDGSKFWTVFVVKVINFGIAGTAPVWYFVALPLALGFYIYGIANAATRPDDRYVNYNSDGNDVAMLRAA